MGERAEVHARRPRRDLTPIADLASPWLHLADGRSADLPDRVWRDPRLHRVTQSVHSLDPLDDLAVRAAAFQAALPADSAYSHVTAAQLFELPLPPALEKRTSLDVMRPTAIGRTDRAGCRGHIGLEARSVIELGGLRVTSPADTWVDLAALRGGMDVEQLVVIGDAVVFRLDRDLPRQSDESLGLPMLAAALQSRRGARGRRLLEQALPRVRARVRSPMETRARLMFVSGGLPEPEVNRDIFDDDGGWLMECDLVWRAQRVGVEYQGAHHASIRARGRDAARRDCAAEADWAIVEMFAADYYDSAPRRRLLRKVAALLGLDPASVRIS